MIISNLYHNQNIFFEEINNLIYLNATKTAQNFNKRLDNWKNSSQTIEYIEVLSRTLKISDRDLFIIRKGGNDKESQGTWIHQKLIIFFARWLSADFAVWCDLQIEEILKLKNSQPTQTPQTLENIDLDLQISQNKKLLELIELITSQTPKNLFFLDKIYKHLSEKSPLKLLGIDLNSYYFIPTELGKFFNKSAVEINKILEHKGLQIKENGVWVLTESGKKFAIQLENKFSTIKWKLEAIL
jgi:hypothetical protein